MTAHIVSQAQESMRIKMKLLKSEMTEMAYIVGDI